jgi:hypothetical protein
MTGQSKDPLTEFGRKVRELLTEEQIAQIAAWHEEVPVSYSGCAARNEGTACCVDAITGKG